VLGFTVLYVIVIFVLYTADSCYIV